MTHRGWYAVKQNSNSSHTSHHPSQTPCLICHSKTDARFMQDGWKAVWSIPYISVAFFPSLKHNFIAYCPDCIFEIDQLWQSGFSRVYSNCCCSCSFEAEIIKIGQSSHKMYSNNILNFQESMTILNACAKKAGNLLNAPRNFFYGWLIDFNGISTHLGLFYASRLGNHIHCMFIITFLLVVSEDFFLTWSFQIWVIFKQIYLTHR